MPACPCPCMSPALLSPRFPLCPNPLTHPSLLRSSAIPGAWQLPAHGVSVPLWGWDRPLLFPLCPASEAHPASSSAAAQSWPDTLGAGTESPSGLDLFVPRGKTVPLCPCWGWMSPWPLPASPCGSMPACWHQFPCPAWCTDSFPVQAPGIRSEAMDEVIGDSFCGICSTCPAQQCQPDPADAWWPLRAGRAMWRDVVHTSLWIPKFEPPSMSAGFYRMP